MIVSAIHVSDVVESSHRERDTSKSQSPNTLLHDTSFESCQWVLHNAAFVSRTDGKSASDFPLTTRPPGPGRISLLRAQRQIWAGAPFIDSGAAGTGRVPSQAVGEVRETAGK
jgi:hypothetical protein